MSSTSKKKPSQKVTKMTNQDANGEGYYPQTVTYQVSATDTDTKITLSNGQTYTYNGVPQTISYPSTTATLKWSLPTVTSGSSTVYSYPSYWSDERKSIPHLCRCEADMSEPHEDHIYIKKIWFCSIKCYQEYLLACIGTDIDER